MKIIFISDIHGIKTNINKIDELIIKLKIDKLVVLGDIYHSYYDNLEYDNQAVKKFLTKYKDKLLLIKGNCDWEINDFDVLEITGMYVDGISMYMTHGNKYNYNKPFEVPNSILIYGHEHIPYVRKKNGVTYICVGSLSLPRNEYGATYMIYDNKKFTIFNTLGNIITEYKLD